MTSSYRAPPHLGVVLTSKRIDYREAAFWTEAVRIQLRDHVAGPWGLPAPGVQLYTPDTFVPVAEGMLIVIADDDGNDDTAGYHTPLGGLVDVGQSRVPSRTLSHEALEMYGNWALDRWRGPDARGRLHAMELCDAVQRVGYPVAVDLYGERRSVEVADFIYPQWFDRDWPSDRLSHCGAVSAPFEIAPGGYSIALDGDDVVYLAHPEAGMNVGRSKVSKRSRTTRIVERFG